MPPIGSITLDFLSEVLIGMRGFAIQSPFYRQKKLRRNGEMRGKGEKTFFKRIFPLFPFLPVLPSSLMVL
jgi:hypothetical protein